MSKAINALLAMGFGRERHHEKIGWCGTQPAPSTPDHFRCEFCKAEAPDCTKIEHKSDCPVMVAREAMSEPSMDRSVMFDPDSLWNETRERLEEHILSSSEALMMHSGGAARIQMADRGVKVTLEIASTNETAN